MGSANEMTKPEQYQQLPKVTGYEVLEQIGAGGMGAVYKARSVSERRLVVLKVPLFQDRANVERFRREAEALQSLKHPNIVKLRHFNTKQTPFFAMDFVEGPNLREMLDDPKRAQNDLENLEWLIHVFEQVAKALQACHRQGLQHRDIKPENIIVSDREAHVVLVDFGLVAIDPKLRRESYETLTLSGQFLGTPGYMAPEQLDNSGDLGAMGPPTDVWGFGATLYRALTGHPPFGECVSLPAWMMSVLESRPEPIETYNSKAPAWLTQLCLRCLQKDPKQRPTMTEILAAFDRRRVRSRKPIIIVASALIALMTLLLWSGMEANPAPTLQLDEYPRVTSSRVLTLSGRVIADQPGHVMLNSRRIKLEPEGRWAVRLKGLREGSHEYKLRAVSEHGQESALQTIVVTVDRTPPSISLEPPEMSGGFLVLRGWVSEPDSQLLFEGERVPIKTQRFHYKRSVQSLDDLTFEVQDRLGNKSLSRVPKFFVLGGQNKSLRSLLNSAPDHSTILIRPGSYRIEASSIRQPLRLVGLPLQRRTCRLTGSIVVEGRGQLLVQDMVLQSARPSAPMLSVNPKGSLKLKSCVLLSDKAEVILGRGQQNQFAELIVEDCQFNGARKSAIRGQFLDLVAEKSDFYGKEAPFKDADHENGLVTVRHSKTQFRHCKFLNSPNHGVKLYQSTATFEACSVQNSAGCGVYATHESQVQLNNCQLSRNFWCGVQIWTRCQMSMNDCKLSENGTLAGSAHARHAVVIIDQSKATVRRSQFESHQLDFFVEASRLKLKECTFKDQIKPRITKRRRSKVIAD